MHMNKIYLSDAVEQLHRRHLIPLMELLIALSLTYDEYCRLKSMHTIMDAKTINLLKAVDLIYSKNLRVRFVREVKYYEEENVKPIESALVRLCHQCSDELHGNSSNYCSARCRQKAYRLRQIGSIQQLQQLKQRQWQVQLEQNKLRNKQKQLAQLQSEIKTMVKNLKRPPIKLIKSMEKGICEMCNNEVSSRALYCSTSCRQKAYRIRQAETGLSA